MVKKILKQTAQGYDLISQKFFATRQHVWPELKELSRLAKPGDKVLDFGCGGGRLLEVLPDGIEYHGLDISSRLLSLAREKYLDKGKNKGKKQRKISFHYQPATSKRLPWPDNYFDLIYSIAVFHHLPSRRYRQEVLMELKRVLKPNGRLVLTVWNLWQPRYRRYLWQNWWQKLTGKSKLDWRDCHIPFRDNQGNVFQRYHHAFTKRELRKMLQQAGWQVEKIENSRKRNLTIIGRNIQN